MTALAGTSVWLAGWGGIGVKGLGSCARIARGDGEATRLACTAHAGASSGSVVSILFENSRPPRPKRRPVRARAPKRLLEFESRPSDIESERRKPNF